MLNVNNILPKFYVMTKKQKITPIHEGEAIEISSLELIKGGGVGNSAAGCSNYCFEFSCTNHSCKDFTCVKYTNLCTSLFQPCSNECMSVNS